MLDERSVIWSLRGYYNVVNKELHVIRSNLAGDASGESLQNIRSMGENRPISTIMRTTPFPRRRAG